MVSHNGHTDWLPRLGGHRKDTLDALHDNEGQAYVSENHTSKAGTGTEFVAVRFGNVLGSNGKLMRKISVDELPQVFNILKGDMSWIGPRPVTTDRPLSEYDQKRKDRLKVKPGITGYTQAYYRNNISQEDKLALDAKYTQKVTFLGDLKIFFKTIETVVCRKNVYTN